MVWHMSEEIIVMDGIPVRSEKIEFDPSQLVACEACGRSNAPNRTECIYCGNALSIVADGRSALKIREVEPWEKAYNIVLIGNGWHGSGSDGLPFDAEVAQKALNLGPPMPIGRVGTADAAAAVNERSSGSGLRTTVVSDESLNAENPPVRLRSLSVAAGSIVLTTFNMNERIKFPSDSLKLIVVGRLFEERSEQSLKKKLVFVKEI